MPLAVRTFVAMILLSTVAFAQSPEGQGGDGPEGGRRRGPPREAVEACQGKSANDACSFSHGEHDVKGTCFTPASDKPLACRPEGGPPGGGRGGENGGGGGGPRR